MIVQCRQCRTKFRFNEAQMEDDGLWMRCSRCHHVFFQENPRSKPHVEPAPDIVPEEAVNAPAFAPAFIDAKAEAPPKAVPPDQPGTKPVEAIIEEKANPAFEPVKREDIRLEDIDLSEGTPVDSETESVADDDDFEEEAMAPPPVRKKGQAWKVALFAVLVIVVIPALIYWVFFPDIGARYVDLARKFIGGEATYSADGQTVATQVKIKDIRQRIANNFVLGNLRIVEGTLINEADYPVARIRIKGEILDAYSVVLGERTSYAGNILTDEELANLSEEEIIKHLSQPEGINNSNERVIPYGQIPFMIVFTSEPPGSIKTTVMVTGAERLL